MCGMYKVVLFSDSKKVPESFDDTLTVRCAGGAFLAGILSVYP